MKKHALVVGGLAAIAIVAATPALAQDDAPRIARSYSIDVLPGHGDEFKSAIKEQISWYRQNRESWSWHLWQWETGGKIGAYVFRSPGHTLKDLDDRAERTAHARANFEKMVLPHIDTMKGQIMATLPAVSHWPEDYGEVPMVSVYEYTLHYGMSEEFEHLMKEIHSAIQKSGWPATYAWSVTISGGAMPSYSLVIPHKSYVDMAGPEQPFWEMMDETVGRQAADSLRKRMNACVKEAHSGLARFMPEFSYMPGQ